MLIINKEQFFWRSQFFSISISSHWIFNEEILLFHLLSFLVNQKTIFDCCKIKYLKEQKRINSSFILRIIKRLDARWCRHYSIVYVYFFYCIINLICNHFLSQYSLFFFVLWIQTKWIILYNFNRSVTNNQTLSKFHTHFQTWFKLIQKNVWKLKNYWKKKFFFRILFSSEWFH